jgi:hypothetical protein
MCVPVSIIGARTTQDFDDEEPSRSQAELQSRESWRRECSCLETKCGREGIGGHHDPPGLPTSNRNWTEMTEYIRGYGQAAALSREQGTDGHLTIVERRWIVNSLSYSAATENLLGGQASASVNRNGRTTNRPAIGGPLSSCQQARKRVTQLRWLMAV